MELVVFASMRKKEQQRADLHKKKRDFQSNLFLRLEKNQGWYHHFLVFMIIFSLTLGIGNSIRGYEYGLLLKLRIAVESFLLVVFIAEYLLRIWSSGAHGTYGAAGGWKKYVVTPHMVIDLLVIISSLGLVISSQLHLSREDRRMMYLLQLLRVVRIDRQRGAFSAFWRVFKKHRKELLTCWYMGFLMVIFVSFLVYALEEKTETEPYTLDNLFDGVYWGVISLTTIGYGDINPETTTGKILICCFAVFGTCFLAMPAGIIGSGFALQVAEQQKEKHVNRRRRPAAVLIQCFWRKYAADHDFAATWLPHTQTRVEKVRKNTGQMFGVPFTPIIPTIQLGRNENGKLSPPILSESNPGSNQSSFRGEVPSRSGNSSPVIVNSNHVNRTLTTAEKIALRFIRFLKCISSTKKFRQARRPYDERDILDQFASSQIEMFAKVRELKTTIEKGHNTTETKTSKTCKEFSKLERKISTLAEELTETKALLKLLLKTQGIDITTKAVTLEDDTSS